MRFCSNCGHPVVTRGGPFRSRRWFHWSRQPRLNGTHTKEVFTEECYGANGIACDCSSPEIPQGRPPENKGRF